MTVDLKQPLTYSTKVDTYDQREIVMKRVLAGLLVATALVASQANAVGILTTVTRIAIEPGRWGGCAARLASNPKLVAGLESCGNWYVSFDCEASSGQGTKSEAQIRLAQAQLAFVAGKRLYVEVDPAVTLNGVCYASRADVLD